MLSKLSAQKDNLVADTIMGIGFNERRLHPDF
jgi:hypothetical protein